jgi:NADH:ubiquinone oxidoreductase subunit 6 (subunit J)
MNISNLLNIMNITFPDFVFLICSALILGCGFIVVYSRNIVHSGFSLLGTFTGVAGFYFLMEANFIAAAQILVYVGGVLIVILFAIMLTRGIGTVYNSNASKGAIPATLFAMIIAAGLIFIAFRFPWKLRTEAASLSVAQLGDALLGQFLIPFEFLSLLLLTALVGAVTLVRKEFKEGGKEEK